jgi:ADP-ribosylglycohydrolase
MENQTTPLLIGALAGDIIGSRFERYNIKSTEFELFQRSSHFTDDTVLTIATAESILNKSSIAEAFQKYGRRYPNAGYGGTFYRWIFEENPQPYNSWGNGSAMRVFLARTGHSKDEIRRYVESNFGYDLSISLDEIRPNYYFDVSCQGSVPHAIRAFLESNDFESAIRLAISIGGDSDTIACISGGIAQAYYKSIPEEIVQGVMQRLPKELLDVVLQFDEKYNASEA